MESKVLVRKRGDAWCGSMMRLTRSLTPVSKNLTSCNAQPPKLQPGLAYGSSGGKPLQAGKLFGRLFASITLMVGVALSSPAFAKHAPKAIGEFDDKAVGDIEQIIQQYISDHPEEILKALQKLQAQQQQAEEEHLRKSAGGVKPVTAADHIRGSADAPVKVIEFSDFECPFCKAFHGTLKQLMAEYGKTGNVVWVYRHFPLDNLHSKARKEAQAAECANELGGNEAFWAYADNIFAVTPSNNRLDLALLPQIAEKIGLDRSKFETCLEGDQRGGRFADHIEENFQDASASGGTGTPFTIIVDAKGQAFPVSGAQPYDAVKSIIDVALKQQ